MNKRIFCENSDAAIIKKLKKEIKMTEKRFKRESDAIKFLKTFDDAWEYRLSVGAIGKIEYTVYYGTDPSEIDFAKQFCDYYVSNKIFHKVNKFRNDKCNEYDALRIAIKAERRISYVDNKEEAQDFFMRAKKEYEEIACRPYENAYKESCADVKKYIRQEND